MKRPARTAVDPAADQGTRDRLVQEAGLLFADRGFQRATVREICAAAGANVAAVNYHFGDKDGLYRAVVQTAIAVMRGTNELLFEAGRGASPEDQLRAYVRVLLERLTGRDRLSWLHRLMTREIEEPGETMRLVMSEVIEPRMAHLGSLVGAIAGLRGDDPRVLRAVLSLQGQVLLFARPKPPGVPAPWDRLLRSPEAMAEHIIAFSLPGIRALRHLPPA
ncbi:MAG: CerR family C-terminal domain-containing protein [Acidobacteria bacterium]|nr:CerR family C-terminal domain-containing protein [Acidobacteriota bacterium]